MARCVLDSRAGGASAGCPLPASPPRMSELGPSSPDSLARGPIPNGWSRASARFSTGVVWSVWAVMVLCALTLATRFADSMPFSDELALTFEMFQPERLEPSHLWAQHNEHRLPLPKLVYLGSVLGTGDARAAIVLSISLLALASAALILAARAVRGSTSIGDAFFPLIWLHWYHAENLIVGFQIAFVLPMALCACALALILRSDGTCASLRPWRFGALHAALPMCCAPGLFAGAVLIPWVAWRGWLGLRSNDERERRAARVLLAFGALAAVLVAVYLIGYRRPAMYDSRPNVIEVGRVAAAFVMQSLGRYGRGWWPSDAWASLGIVVLLAWLVSRRGRAGLADGRVLGLAALGGAPILMGAGIGIGRAGFDIGVTAAPRYALLTSTVACGIVGVALLCAPRVIARWLSIGAACLWGSVALQDRELGRMVGEVAQRTVESVHLDVRAGLSAAQIAERNWTKVFPDENALRELLVMRRDAHMAPFDRVWERRLVPRRALTEIERSVFAPLRLAPRSWSGAMPPVARPVLNDPVLVVGERSELSFACSRNARRVRGHYGLLRAATLSEGSDGLEFRIEQGEGAARRVLWRETLDPRARAEDGGRHSFWVDLQGNDGTPLWLVTGNPPGHDARADWGYWSGIQVD